MDVVPIKVTLRQIPRTARGATIEYPPFERVPDAARLGLPWQQLVDAYGGPIYDKASGFGETDPESPDPLLWHVVYLVPSAFAAEAEARWPERVTRLTEAALETFYDRRSLAASSPDETVSPEVLAGLRAKYAQPAGLLVPDATWSQADKDAIDPRHPAPGIVRNARKRWSRLKAARGYRVV